jgi:predicted NUDIX family NTP pyrophosphohydrolase
MPKRSAGILMYRRAVLRLELLLVHPGGPFWKKRDAGAWSIPKGEYAPGEDPLAVAVREFEEETGAKLLGEFQLLGELVQKGGKIVAAWAMEGDLDPATIRSNTFEIEWPPRAAARRLSLRSTAPDGFRPTRRARKFCRANALSSGGWRSE